MTENNQTGSAEDLVQRAVKNNSCGNCRRLGYAMCKCPPKKPGAGSDGDESSSEKKKTQDQAEQTSKSQSQGVIDALLKFDKTQLNWARSQLLDNQKVEYQGGLFFVEAERLKGKFVMRMQPGLSKTDKEALHEILKGIKKKFEEFKEDLADRGISTKNFTADLTDNKLVINIPVPQQYDNFIKALAEKNLLPIPDFAQQKLSTDHSVASKQKPSYLNPLPTTLKRG